MTQVTRERAHELVERVAEAYDWESGLGEKDAIEERDELLRYITQLEANQRQPVSDEKLKEAMQWLTFYKIKNGESSRKTLSVEFHFDSIDPDTRESALSRYMRHMDEIEASLSELETLRAASKWQPTKGKLLNVIGTYLAFPDDGNIIEGLAEEIISQDWSQVNDQQRPTPPAQEV